LIIFIQVVASPGDYAYHRAAKVNNMVFENEAGRGRRDVADFLVEYRS
jgi:hypothetical protein